MLSVGVFLRDPSPYLREFRRKPRKTPNGYVDKRDQGLNLAPPVYQFLSAATGGVMDGQFDIHALPGIRTRNLSSYRDLVTRIKSQKALSVQRCQINDLIFIQNSATYFK